LATRSFLAVDDIVKILASKVHSRTPEVPIIIILDCCRSDVKGIPQENFVYYESNNGGPSNIFIMQATAPGKVAFDGKVDGNGAFTAKLLSYMDKDEDIETISKSILTELEKEKSGAQVSELAKNNKNILYL
jgi:hypothetical protein